MQDIEEKSSTRDLALGDESEVVAEPVAALEPVRVPTVALKAALACTGEKRTDLDGKKHDVPASLQGVNIAAREAEIRISATDGQRLFAFSQPVGSGDPPEWLTSGVTISLELLKDQLGIIEKLGGEAAIVSYQTGAARVLLSDPREFVTFRSFPVEGDFPNYDAVLNGIDLSGHTTLDLASTAYQATYFKGVADLAKLLGSQSVQVFGSAGNGKPTLITFPGCPGAVLVLMPLVAETTIAPQTARVIGGAVAGTLAALRAHRTRWEKKLAKLPSSRAIQKKIEEYDQRIDAIVARTAPALPIPAAAEDDDPIGESDSEALARLARPEMPIADADPDMFKARLRAQQVVDRENRAKLKGAAAKKAVAKFHADVNAVLSRDHDGLTIHQLADGVPLDSWWETGLSPEEAARRCLDWRQEPAEEPAEQQTA
jgi:hypothetical protein